MYELTLTGMAIHMVGADMTDQTAMAQACLSRAAAKINGSLAQRYELSSSHFATYAALPPLVEEWGTMLGAGYAWQNLARAGAGKEAWNRGAGLIKEVLDDLKLVAKREIALTDEDGDLIPEGSNTANKVNCSTSDYEPTIDEGSFLGMRVDPDKIEDIADEKDFCDSEGD